MIERRLGHDPSHDFAYDFIGEVKYKHEKGGDDTA